MPKLTQKSIDRSRRLRTEPTDAERALWRQLRQRQFAGFKFRRQHPVGQYFVDFACIEAGLCIELDGGQHLETTDYDAMRTAFLNKSGFEVLRFWDHDVLTHIESVKEVIWNALEEIKARRGE